MLCLIQQDSIDALHDLPKVQMMDLFGAAYIRPIIVRMSFCFPVCYPGHLEEFIDEFTLMMAMYLFVVQIAVGLMACQQLGGVNGINFYVSEVFVAAGTSFLHLIKSVFYLELIMVQAWISRLAS